MKTMIATLIGLSVVAAPAAAGINGRQHNQRARIAQGVRSGELTRGETRQLARQQYRIARTEHRMRRDGGGLSVGERARLEVC